MSAGFAGHPAVIVLARRGTEGTGQLDDALAALARHLPDRLELPGLGVDAVGAILGAAGATDVEPDVVAALADRTGGNPFFVRETARLLAAEGVDAAVSAVPAGVRDVLGRRIARLPAAARTVLVHAAVLGRDIGLDLLVELTGQPEDVVLDAVEAGLVLGLLTEPHPGRLAFPHALVRDTLYESTSRLRRSRLHASAAAAIERIRPDDVAALADHYAAAADPVLAGPTARFARLAAREAERRYAYREATRLWQRALAAFDQLGGPTRERLELLLGQVRALASAGDLVSSRQLRSETLRVADSIGDPLLTAAAIASFDVPTLWTNRAYGIVDVEVVEVVERTERTLRQLPVGASEPRCRLLVDLALELEGEARSWVA